MWSSRISEPSTVSMTASVLAVRKASSEGLVVALGGTVEHASLELVGQLSRKRTSHVEVLVEIGVVVDI